MSFGPYCYFNHGRSMRTVDEGYKAEDGEVVFLKPPTADQLSAVFENHDNMKEIDEAHARIIEAESLITPRVIREAISKSKRKFTDGKYEGMTALEMIEAVNKEIDGYRKIINVTD